VSGAVRPVVAIDGQAGSGKSTLARRLAAHLGLPYLNTGLMYRALALRALRAGVDPGDGAGLARLAGSIGFDLDLRVSPLGLANGGEAPEDALTSPEVESTVSQVSRHPEVRAVLREEQRRLAQGGAVMEGRDIGTVVAPESPLKIYLEAHPEERVERRAQERAVGPDEVAEALESRDSLDSLTNPAVPAPDAVAIDTTDLSPDEVLERALELARERGLAP